MFSWKRQHICLVQSFFLNVRNGESWHFFVTLDIFGFYIYSIYLFSTQFFPWFFQEEKRDILLWLWIFLNFTFLLGSLSSFVFYKSTVTISICSGLRPMSVKFKKLIWWCHKWWYIATCSFYHAFPFCWSVLFTLKKCKDTDIFHLWYCIHTHWKLLLPCKAVKYTGMWIYLSNIRDYKWPVKHCFSCKYVRSLN